MTRLRLEPPGLVLLLAAALCLSAAASAKEVPFLTGRVVDRAGLLTEAAAADLERRLAAFEEETGAQVVVLTEPSLEGDSLEDFSIRVVDTWELGREGVDDGVLLLVVQQERLLRLEVGYGLEGAITDAHSRRILDHIITPRFRSGDFVGGIEAGVEAVLTLIRGEELPAPRAPGGQGLGCAEMLVLLLIFVFFLMIVSAMIRGAAEGMGRSGRGWTAGRHRRGGYRGPPIGGGGFSGGGGFGGFSGGGGGFGGGGASGGW